MGRVLLVDDEPMLTLLLRMVLENEGQEVRDAATADDALAQISGWGPDVVVTELTLPDLGGPELVKRMRLRGGPGMRIIATSSSVPHDLDVEAAFLKPYEAQLVAKDVDALLDDEPSEPVASWDVVCENAALRARATVLDEIRNHLLNVDTKLRHCDPESDLALDEIRRLSSWIDGRTSRNHRPVGLRDCS